MTYLGSRDPLLSIASGDFSGISHTNKFGVNFDLDTGTTPEDIWSRGGLWVAPTTARTHDIVSASVNDAAAGTGMRTMRIYGLNSAFNPQQEDITLNGTTNVPTANTYLRIFRMHGLTWGSGGVNAGVITATAQTDATVTAEIATTNSPNQTEMAIYTTPNSKTGYLTNYYASISRNVPLSASADMSVMIRDANETDNGWRKIHEMTAFIEAPLIYSPKPYIVIPEKHDVRIQCDDISDNNTGVSAGFDLILVD